MASVMLELWGTRNSFSLPLPPSLLWPIVVAPDRVLSMGKKNYFTFKLCPNKWLILNWIVKNRSFFFLLLTVYKHNYWYFIELLVIHSNTWNHLTVSKKMSFGSFKNVINKMYLQIIYLIYIYEKNLPLNNLQWFICCKSKPKQTRKTNRKISI